ncbi:hypothetical protein PR202_ga03309 [Eleusine coracana subsp. coracana]|uniref:HMA domain-containing protein n=1 Tax=Eleusine coracana subsp. coracana TaxID=191504 RepID=A0AAV5BN38_ELECO|nr:hypothetical protein PR202_ga03309 [Eleusine coracana subsp. coracana]
MGKKKKRSGGGCGGGGGGQQPKPAEEKAAHEWCEKTAAEDKHQQEDCDNKGKEEKGKKAAALPVVTAVLKVDMHCHGCAKRIRASVRHYTGVEGVALEVDKGSMTVVGRFDAKKLRDRVAKKTNKKVELVVNPNNNKGKDDDEESKKKQQQQQQGGGEFKVHDYGKPDYMCDLYWLDKAYVDRCNKLPFLDIKAIHDYHAKQNKDNKPSKEDNKPSCTGGGGGGGKGNKEDNKEDKGKGGKKPTVPVVATVVLKIGGMGLHCEGCMKRVRAKLFNIKGDHGHGQEPGDGDWDHGHQAPTREAPKEDALPSGRGAGEQGQGERDGNKQEGCKDAKDKDNKDGNKQQEGGGGGCKDKDAKALNAEMLMWKTAFYDQHSLLNTEFMLSDDNPNACCVM